MIVLSTFDKWELLLVFWSFSIINFSALINGLANQVPVVQNHRSRILLKEGALLRLICPVIAQGRDSDSSTADETNSPTSEGVFYEWSVKNLPTYSLTTDPRYKFSSSSRIFEIVSPVKESDSGQYQCSGTTGFGNQKVIFHVQILDSATYRSKCAVSKTGDVSRQAPCFVNSLSRDIPHSIVRAELGEAVELSCEAYGDPEPTYTWYMGSKIEDRANNLIIANRRESLRISKVASEHDNRYTCRVENDHGSLNHTFELIIKEPTNLRPKLVTPFVNYSYTPGAKVDVTVKILCECQPLVQWIKRAQANERNSLLAKGMKLITLPNYVSREHKEEYVILSSFQLSTQDIGKSHTSVTPDNAGPQLTYRAEKDFFVSSLEIPEFRNEDAGKYIILVKAKESAVSSDLMNYQAIHLYSSIDATSINTGSNHLIVYIAAPLCILILMVSLCVYCLIKRYQKNHRPPGALGSRSCTSSSAATTTAMNGDGAATARLTLSKGQQPLPDNNGYTNQTNRVTGKSQYCMPLLSQEATMINAMSIPGSSITPGNSAMYYHNSTTSPSISPQTQFMYRGGPSPPSMMTPNGPNSTGDVSSASIQLIGPGGGGYFPGNNSSSSNGGYSTGHFQPPSQPNPTSQHFIVPGAHYPA